MPKSTATYRLKNSPSGGHTTPPVAPHGSRHAGFFFRESDAQNAEHHCIGLVWRPDNHKAARPYRAETGAPIGPVSADNPLKAFELNEVYYEQHDHRCVCYAVP